MFHSFDQYKLLFDGCQLVAGDLTLSDQIVIDHSLLFRRMVENAVFNVLLLLFPVPIILLTNYPRQGGYVYLICLLSRIWVPAGIHRNCCESKMILIAALQGGASNKQKVDTW